MTRPLTSHRRAPKSGKTTSVVIFVHGYGADGKDLLSHHLMGFQDKTLVAYSRLVSPGISYLEPSIGRVITARGYRHNGYGKELMRKSIEGIEKLYGKTPIRIGAQVYLMKFYETFGFKQDGIPYLEDGIDHVKMLRLL